MTKSCEQCKAFRSTKGLRVRAFECEGKWASMSAAGATTALAMGASALHLPIERFGPGHVSSFYPPEYGASLLALASSNPSDEHVRLFDKCARREVSPPLLRIGPWANSTGPRPTSLLLERRMNLRYASYSNSFGFTLRSGAMKNIGYHAFDSWTTKPRPACKNESLQAAMRLDAVRKFCDKSEMTFESKPCDPQHCRQDRKIQPRKGRLKLNSSNLEQWPAHAALSRMLAGSDANCKFKGLVPMLRQQALFHSMLQSSGLLARCPHASYAGAISQIATIYDINDVTGIFVFDWIPSHLSLATLAFKQQLPLPGGKPLQLVRFSRRSRGDGGGQAHRTNAQTGRSAEQVPDEDYDEAVTCSCEPLPWTSRGS